MKKMARHDKPYRLVIYDRTVDLATWSADVEKPEEYKCLCITACPIL